MRRDKILKAGLQLIAGATMLLASGCATPLAKYLAGGPEADIGYVVAGHLGESGSRDEFASEIARDEFERLRAEKQVDEMTLGALEMFLGALQKPIVLDADDIVAKVAEKNVKPSDVEALKARLQQQPGLARIDGAVHHPPWKAAISRADERLTELRKKKAALLMIAEAAATEAELAFKGGKFTEAAKAGSKALGHYRAAADIHPEDAQLQEKLRGTMLLRDKSQMLAALIEVENTQFRKAVEQQAVFHKPGQSTQQKVKAVVDTLDLAQRTIDAQRTQLQTSATLRPALDELEKTIRALEVKLEMLRGKCWAETVWLLGQDRQFWRIYTYTVERVQEIMKRPSHVQSPLKRALDGEYLLQLPLAIQYFRNKGDDRMVEDAYGVALIHYRMADEMADYARLMGHALKGETAQAEASSVESRRETERKLKQVMTRRLVVEDFVAEGPEGKKLSNRLRQACHEAFVDTRGLVTRAVWAVEIAAAKPGEGEKGDYLVEGSVSEISVQRLDPVELDRKMFKRKGEVTDVPNPDKKLYGAEETVRSQDMVLWQSVRRKVQVLARARIDAKVIRGDNVESIGIDTRFPESGTLTLAVRDASGKYKHVPLKLEAVQEELTPTYAPPVLGVSEIAEADPIPTPEFERLSPDTDIKDALRAYAANNVLAKLYASLAAYPVGTLAATAYSESPEAYKKERRDPARRDVIKEAEYWGRCLEYLYRLTVSQSSAQDGGPSWLQDRSEMQKRVGRKVQDKWKLHDPVLLEQLKDIWRVAVKSARACLEEDRQL